MNPIERQLLGDRVVQLSVLAVALLAVPIFVPGLAPGTRAFHGGFLAEAVLLGIALAAFGQRRRASGDRAERLFHGLVCIGLALWLAQKAVSWLEPVAHAPLRAFIEDVLLVGFYSSLAVAVLLRPDRGKQPPLLGPRRLLDLVGTVLFTLALLAYFSGIPVLTNPDLYLTNLPSMVMVVVLDGVLVLRFAWALRHAPQPAWRATYACFLLTSLLWLATDVLEGLMYGRVVPESRPGTAWDLIWWMPFLPLVAAGRVRSEAPAKEARTDASDASGAHAALVPTDGGWGDALVGYAAAFPLLHVLLYTTGVLDPATRAARETLALVVLVVLAGLAVAYQKLLLAENRRLEAIRLRAVQAEHRAYHDALTGLPNRYLLFDRLEVSLARARRTGGRLALLFLDLDRFKVVNDSLGHSLGDRLLREVAERLARQVRKGDTLARLGGDEFTLLLETAPHLDDAVTVARKLREVLREPFLLEGHELFVSTSIGIALYPDDGAEVGELLKSSDIAMYRAKQQGGDGFQLYQPEMNARAEERLSLESSLRKALGLGQLALQFQPMVATSTGRLVGYEALLRWHHPEKGLLMPGEFIELAEVTGVILEIGPWVLREACREAVTWESEGHPPCVAVNLSARQFHDRSLVGQVEATLAETGLDPRRLELEITESLAMQNPDDTGATLQALRALGVKLSIDDFGTGYSSLGYLKRFPVDTLKVDRSFVKDIGRAPEDATIAATIVAMARTLGLRVVAEGVEDEAQLEVLKGLDCDFAQGHLFGAPRWPEGLRAEVTSTSRG